MEAGTELVVETIGKIAQGTVTAVEQPTVDPECLKGAPKIFKETCRIDWNKSLKQVYDFVRGLSPYPAAWTELRQPDGKVLVLKVYEAGKVNAEHNLHPGTVCTDGKTFFHVAVQGGYLDLLAIQLAGKKRMNVADFLRGYKLSGEHEML